jgi:hypothetical protein
MGLLGFRIMPKKKLGIGVIKNNIFIGGMSATMNTPASLRSGLGFIAENLITNVIVDGEDVSCRVDTDFNLNAQAFRHNLSIKWYIDLDGHCKSISDAAFRSNAVGDGRMTKVYLPGCDAATASFNFYRKSTLREIIITSPSLVQIGSTNLDEANWGGLTPWGNTKLWANINLQTSNGGGVDADIAYFIGRGGQVTWVSNYTKPGLVSTFNPTQVLVDSVEFAWSAPTALNGVMKYEIYLDDMLVITTTKLNIRVAGLTNGTVHKIQIRATDLFYNVGELTTKYILVNGATVTWQDSLISYYNFDDNVLDLVGANNGTATNVVYEPAISGNGVVLNGVDSLVDLNSTTIVGGKNAFSIVVMFKMVSVKNQNIIYGSWNLPFTAILRVDNGNLQFYTFTEGQIGGTVAPFSDITSYHSLIATYDGATMKVYLDGVLQATTYKQTGATGTGGESEAWGRYGTGFGNFVLDGGGFFDKAVTQTEVNEIYAIQTAGNELVTI